MSETCLSSGRLRGRFVAKQAWHACLRALGAKLFASGVFGTGISPHQRGKDINRSCRHGCILSEDGKEAEDLLDAASHSLRYGGHTMTSLISQSGYSLPR